MATDQWTIDIENTKKELRSRFLRAQSLRIRIDTEFQTTNTISRQLAGDLDSYMADEMIGINRTIKAIDKKLEDTNGTTGKKADKS
jgi:hypothetical protein